MTSTSGSLLFFRTSCLNSFSVEADSIRTEVKLHLLMQAAAFFSRIFCMSSCQKVPLPVINTIFFACGNAKWATCMVFSYWYSPVTPLILWPGRTRLTMNLFALLYFSGGRWTPPNSTGYELSTRGSMTSFTAVSSRTITRSGLTCFTFSSAA